MAKAAKEQAVKTTGGGLAKVKEVGKNTVGGGAKAAGSKAKAHVSRNRAAYIAGGAELGAGLAAGGIAGAAPGRKKTPQEPEINQCNSWCNITIHCNEFAGFSSVKLIL